MAEPTVSAGFARALLDFAVAKGVEAGRLYAGSGLNPCDLEDQDDRIPYAAYVALMRAAIAETKNPALPLEYGADSDFRRYSIVGLIAHSAPTMAAALEQMNRYSRLVIEVDGLGDGPRFALAKRDDGLWLEDRRLNPNAFPELTETTWSRFICGSRRSFPNAVFALEAEVTHEPPAHAAEYERVWRVPVRFGAARNAIRMNPLWPTLPVAPESRYVFGVLSERAEALLRELQSSRTLRGRIEKELMPLLHTGDVGMEKIAAKLGMSRQTLFRKLKAEGATFEKTLDDLRQRLAMHYLTGKKVSVNETAYLLGFSDPAAFSRAFKRWTGISPREVKPGPRALERLDA
jgi:AraC-like DNA-binding protein